MRGEETGKIQGMEMTLSTVRLVSLKSPCETHLTSLTCADRMKVEGERQAGEEVSAHPRLSEL